MMIAVGTSSTNRNLHRHFGTYYTLPVRRVEVEAEETEPNVLEPVDTVVLSWAA